MVGAHDWIGNLVQNGAIDPVQLTAEQKAAFARDRAQGGHLQRPDLRRAVRDREPRADPQHRPGARPRRPRSRTWSRPARSSRPTRRSPRSCACRSAQNGDAYHIYPLYASAGGSCSAPPPPATTTRRTSASASPSRSRRSRRSRRSARRATARSSARSPRELDRHLHRQEVRVPGLRPVGDHRREEGRHQVRHQRRSPASPAASRPSRSSACRRSTSRRKGKNKALAQEFVANYVTNPDLAVALYEAEPRPPALTAALDQVKAHRPGPGQVPRGRQERRPAAGHPGDGGDLGPVRQGRGGGHRRRRPGKTDQPRPRKTISGQIK